MYLTLQEVGIRFLISPSKTYEYNTGYLKDVKILLAFLLSNNVFKYLLKNLPRVLQNKILCSR